MLNIITLMEMRAIQICSTKFPAIIKKVIMCLTVKQTQAWELLSWQNFKIDPSQGAAKALVGCRGNVLLIVSDFFPSEIFFPPS